MSVIASPIRESEWPPFGVCAPHDPAPRSSTGRRIESRGGEIPYFSSGVGPMDSQGRGGSVVEGEWM